MVGCGGPAVTVPKYDAERITAAAFELYDKNKDGKLDAEELKACPALAEALANIDKNKDKCIDVAELRERVEGIAKSKTGLVGVRLRIKYGGRPLGGATVNLVPEKFMGDAVKPANGVSDAGGSVTFQIAGTLLQGVSEGYYRVQIESPTEKLPAKYNSDTMLGKEITSRMRGSWEIDLAK
jgi:hypothetical protein